MYPKYLREPWRRYPGPCEVTVDGFRIEGVDSSERPQRFKPHPAAEFPDGTGPFVGDGAFPNLGFVITELEGGLTFYHPGDLGDVFDAHRELRGRIDFMFLPVPKLQGLELTMIDAIRPKCLIPIHYRTSAPDFPIPLHISQDDLELADIHSAVPKPGADPVAWRREMTAMMEAHFYPTTPEPPLQRLESITPALEALGARVAVLEAGRAYDLNALPGPAR
jgi:L-ascorbate metabolism protein UlaG (beta-lactamase superfamily)